MTSYLLFSDDDDDDAFSASFDEDMDALRRACLLNGAATTSSAPGPWESVSDSDSDDLEAFRRLRQRFFDPASEDMANPLTTTPFLALPPPVASSCSDGEEDDFETVRAIQNRFSAYDHSKGFFASDGEYSFEDILESIEDLEISPENFREFLPKVKWDQLASMYVRGRTGAGCEARWLNWEDPLINKKRWTADEDKQLLSIIQMKGLNNWFDTAVSLGAYQTPFQCLTRYQRSLIVYIMKREWTPDEDAMLRVAVETLGCRDWQAVAFALEGRTGIQCSNRWDKTLHPKRQGTGRWDVEEDQCLKVAVMLFGPTNWRKISDFVPGRTHVQFRERGFWRRHRRKIFIGLGIVGSGYCAYKLYDAHRKKLVELEREITNERENDELAKAQLSEPYLQLQAHFENIQRIANTTTLPHAIHYLNGRILEELDLSRLTERLMRGKGQPVSLTPAEKLDLWDQLKVLSFTKLLSSIWGMAMLSLYIRVQVNILGRHLYIDAAHGLGISQLLEGDSIGVDDQQKFLASADFLSSHGLPALTSYMQEATREVLKGKHLRDNFDNNALHEVILQVLDKFMGTASRHHWVGYLMPENDRSEVATTSDDNSILPVVTTFGQLMAETESVLLSSEFSSVVDMALKMLVNAVVEDFALPAGGSAVPFKMPLAKLLPRVAQMGPQLLEEPSKNRYIQLIGNSPEIELFFTLLYAKT